MPHKMMNSQIADVLHDNRLSRNNYKKLRVDTTVRPALSVLPEKRIKLGVFSRNVA